MKTKGDMEEKESRGRMRGKGRNRRVRMGEKEERFKLILKKEGRMSLCIP